jgi:hypothetical protein
MRKRIDVAEVGQTAEARALLDQLDDGKVISLGVLSGADLCALGATRHPVCWEALKGAWRRLDQKEREYLAETSTLGMVHRDLIKDQPPGRGVEALIVPASYKLSAELGILLGARKSPALIVATHHESRTPAITYFQPQGASAIVEEIPERADNGAPGTPGSPLGVIFSYRLLTPAVAAGELARWAMKPIPVARYQPKPPRLICFFGRTDGDSPTSYQLTIHANGEKAHVDGPDLSADLDSRELTVLMTDVMTKWAPRRGRGSSDRSRCATSLPRASGRLPASGEWARWRRRRRREHPTGLSATPPTPNEVCRRRHRHR